MSTLTVEVVAAPRAVFGVVRHEFEPDRPGLVEALGDGWGAFVAGGYAVVLAAATVLPFLAVAALVMIAVALGPPDRQARRNDRQPSGVSTQSAWVPSGKENGAAARCGRRRRAVRGLPARRPNGASAARRPRRGGAGHRRARSFRGRRRPARSRRVGDRLAGRVPLEVERNRARRPVGAAEGIVGVVERGGVRLVGDGPLLHRRVARVLGPQGVGLDEQRVGAHRHLPLGDVEQRFARRASAAQYHARRPSSAMADTAPREPSAEPAGEHPLLHGDAGVAAAREPGRCRQTVSSATIRHTRAVVRYLSLDWIDALSPRRGRRRAAARAGDDARARAHPGRRRRARGRRDVPPAGRRRRSPVRSRAQPIPSTSGWSSRGARRSPSPPAISTPRRRSSTAASGCTAISSACSTPSLSSAPSTHVLASLRGRTEYV